MKAFITTTMFTTGASLVILAVFFAISGEETLNINGIFEIFGANIIINAGIHLRFNFEIRYFMLEFLIDVSYVILVLCVFGIIFNWFNYVPVWYLALMAGIIYIFVIATTVFKVKKDTKEINDLLQKRKEKDEDFAS